MDYEAYKNRLPYPKKEDYTNKFWYKSGKLIAQEVAGNLSIFVLDVDLKDCTTEKELDRRAYDAARRIYGDETAHLEEKFRQFFFYELGIENHPKRDKLYAKAYEHGHSAGYAEIMNYGYDFVELIKD